MHICFASLDYPDSTSGGGVGNYVKTIACELIKRGHHVSVIALRKNKELPEITDDNGVDIHWITSGNVHWYVSKLPFIGGLFALSIREIEYSNAVLKAIRTIDRGEPLDIVEGIETGALGFIRLRKDIKTVIRLHGERYTFAKFTPPGHIPVDVRISRYLQRRSFLNADKLTAPSRAHANEISSELKWKYLPIKVIPNPVTMLSAERVRRDPLRPIFLFVGRLQLSKGILDLLRAIPLIASKIPGAHFVIAGNEHPSVKREEIGSNIKELGIESSVEFHGHVDIRKLGALYVQASAVVLPSYYESFGYVPLEALMRGIPVVAYDAGAVRDVIRNGENGFLVPAGDIAALAEACVKAITMGAIPADRSEISKYSKEYVCSETIAAYENLFLRS
jgi:glycogen(starch) synthase